MRRQDMAAKMRTTSDDSQHKVGHWVMVSMRENFGQELNHVHKKRGETDCEDVSPIFLSSST
jgi:hypothetical protein